MRKNRLLVSLLVLTLCLGLITACGGQSSAPAQTSTAPQQSASTTPAPVTVDFPKKPIEIVIPFGAGGDTDLFARAMAEAIGTDLGVSVIVTNMTGASGSLSTSFVKDANPDGYTVLFCHNTLLSNRLMGITDYTHDAFTPACLSFYNEAVVLCKGAAVQDFNSVEELVSYAKANPGALNFSTVYGGSMHLLAVALSQDANIEMNLIDAGGSGPMAIEVLGNRASALISVYPGIKQYIDSGELIPLATASENRIPELPDVPTLKELGYDIVNSQYYGFYFPANTDPAIVDIFNAAAERAYTSESVKAIADQYNATPVFIPGEEAAKTMDEVDKFYARFEDTFA